MPRWKPPDPGRGERSEDRGSACLPRSKQKGAFYFFFAFFFGCPPGAPYGGYCQE